MPFFATLIINLIIGIALSVASTLIQQALQHDKKQKPAGVRGSIQTGGDHPLSFIMGFYATPGHLEYAGTWGNVDETPNAYYTKVISLSDLPVRGLAGVFVNGQRVTLGGVMFGSVGYPVEEYNVDGVDHLWVKFHDGSQTTVDGLLTFAFGSDPDRPWLSDMIGRGVAYVIVTALANRELFTGLPEYLFEVDGISLPDDEDENPVAAISTILQGISYDGDWVYGPQGIGASRLPSANWDAELAKCNEAIDLAAGGDEPRFRFGMEVSVDTEPHVVIGELLKACEGRIAEIGGIYKVLVGEPGAPVKSLTDEDIVITQGQTYEPFPGLESTYNAITATYPEPLEAWENKDAPPRYDSGLEADDDGRRLPFSTSYGAVPFPNQVQRLMLAAIVEARRFRRHSFTAPPEWWEYEPLDVAEWDSDRNGYVAKQFLITVMDDLSNGNQVVGLQEIDPTDYDWDSDFELPYDVSPLGVSAPSPQPMTGWAVAPYIHVDPASNARRPAIEVDYAGGLVDVRAVRVQVRNDGATLPFFDGEFPYDRSIASPKNYIVAGGILPDTDYEVRGKFLPFSGRRTDWSSWLAVTTPDIRLGAGDIYPIDMTWFGDDVSDYLSFIGSDTRAIIEELERLSQISTEQLYNTFTEIQSTRTELTATAQNVTAAYILAIDVAAGPNSALARRVETLEVSLTDVNGDVTAIATAVNAVIVRVDNHDGDISALAASITSLDVQINGPDGESGMAEAVNLLQVRVDDEDTGLQANADAITALTTTVGDTTAGVTFRMHSGVGPAGYLARIEMQAAATFGGVWRAAGFVIDISSTTARVAVLAPQFVVSNSDGSQVAAVFEGDTTFIENARIHNLEADNITAHTITADEIVLKGIDLDDIIIDGTGLTGHLHDNAVTETAGFSNNADVTGVLNYADLANASITPVIAAANGGAVYVEFSCHGRSTTGANPIMFIDVIRTVSGVDTSVGTDYWYWDDVENECFPYLLVRDTGFTVGVVNTYTAKILGTSSGGNYGVTRTNNRRMRVMSLKK